MLQLEILRKSDRDPTAEFIGVIADEKECERHALDTLFTIQTVSHHSDV